MNLETQSLNPDPSEPQPGSVVAGQYQLRRLIGRGGFGLVYDALHQDSGRQVALKLLLPRWVAQDQEIAIRFRREAVLASQLKHHHTITLYDYGQTRDGLLYMAMEFVEGPTLSQVLRDQAPVASERVIRILAQTLSSLQEAHTLGIVHRDLKPGNIMLTRRGDDRDFVKVLDFGIAKALTNDLLEGQEGINQTLTQAGQFCGTPRYMAPEQFRGGPVTPACDLYSMGLIAYELLTGQPALKGETMVDLIVQQVAGPDLRLPKEAAAPEALRQIVHKALRKNRDERYQTAESFRLDLERCLRALDSPLGQPSAIEFDSTNQISPDRLASITRRTVLSAAGLKEAPGPSAPIKVPPNAPPPAKPPTPLTSPPAPKQLGGKPGLSTHSGPTTVDLAAPLDEELYPTEQHDFSSSKPTELLRDVEDSQEMEALYKPTAISHMFVPKSAAGAAQLGLAPLPTPLPEPLYAAPPSPPPRSARAALSEPTPQTIPLKKGAVGPWGQPPDEPAATAPPRSTEPLKRPARLPSMDEDDVSVMVGGAALSWDEDKSAPPAGDDFATTELVRDHFDGQGDGATLDISRSELFHDDLQRDHLGGATVPTPFGAEFPPDATQEMSALELGPRAPLRFSPSLEAKRQAPSQAPHKRSAPEASPARPRWLWVALGGLGLMLLLASALALKALLEGLAPQPAPPAQPPQVRRVVTQDIRLQDPNGRTVTVRLDTTPDEAEVMIGDELIGKTPLELVRNEGTREQVRLHKAGHLTYATELDFSQDKTLPVTLQPNTP